MLRWLVATSLKFRLLVVALAVGVVALGVSQLGSARAETLPEFDPVYIEVQTEALGLSAVEVEQLITAPLEADLLNGVAYVDDVRSSSIPGLSSVVLTFEPGTPLTDARQLVQERLTQAGALPHVSKPPVMLEPVSSARRTMMIGLSSKDLSLIEQSVLARWTIRPKLSGVPGVANVAIFGQRERQLQVLIDPAKLAAAGVTLQQVISTTGNAMWVSPLTFLEASTPGTGGFIDTPNQRLGVRHVSPVVDAAALSQVALEGNPALRLADVATVVEDNQPLIGDAVTNDSSGLMLVIEKFPDANTLDVTRGVEAALDDLRPGLSGLEFDTSLYRPAGFIESAIGNVWIVVLLGLALAALLIWLFFGAWRPAVIAVAVIPVSLAGAAAVLLLTGTPLNFLVLLGLTAAIAIVIDEALTGTDATVRAVHRLNGESTAAAILQAVVRTRTALAFATVIAAVAVAPVFVIPGSLGALLAPLAIAYLVAIVVALVVAATLTPALALLLSRGAPKPTEDSRVLRSLRSGYGRFAPRLVTRSVPALIATLGLIVVGVALVPVLGTSLAPSLKEPYLLVEFEGAAATSQPEQSRIVAAATSELRALPGVQAVGAHIGRAILSDQVADVNSGEIWVQLDPAANYDSTRAAVEDVVAGYPGLQRNVSSYLKERGTDLLARPNSDLVVRVYGSDLPTLDAKAEEVRAALAGVDGLVDPTVARRAQDPTIQITVDLAAAQRFGLKPGDVRRATATQVNGISVGSIFERQKVFDVIVRGVPEVRDSVTAIQNLLVDRPDGAGQVRLGDVALVQVGPSPSVVERESVSRYLDVVASVSGRNRGDVVTDAASALRTVAFPVDYRAEIRSGYADDQSAIAQAVAAAVAALIVIFLLLQAAFRRWRLAVLAFLTLPVALVGGLVAAFLGGGVVTIGSLAGLLTVLVIAVRHLVVLVRHYQDLEDGGDEFGPALVQLGTRDRVGPIVMTTLAVAAAMVPMAVAGPIAGLELISPMAVVVIGGLITSAALNLLIVPALYLRFAGGGRPAADEADVDVPAERAADLAPSATTTTA